MFSIIDLAGKRPDKLDPAEIQYIKDFIIGASRNINEKILNLEADHHVNIKLAPLPKKVVNVRQGDPLMSFPIMTTAHVNTGLHGSFKYPNTVNVNVPFLLDPIGGNGGENYKQRLNKMLEYIKIYKIVKTQLEAYKASITPTSNPDDIKKARSKVSSQYVEFLPDTVEDKENIEKYEDSAFTEDDIESIAKQILNPTNPLSSPPATPPATATATSTTVRAPVTASIRAPAPATATTVRAPVPTSTASIRAPAPATAPAPAPTSFIDKKKIASKANTALALKGLVLDENLIPSRNGILPIPPLKSGQMFTTEEVELLNRYLRTGNVKIAEDGTMSDI